MNAYEAACEALIRLNEVELKGEVSIAAMSRAISLIRGIKEACERVAALEAAAREGDNSYDDHDGQREHV